MTASRSTPPVPSSVPVPAADPGPALVAAGITAVLWASAFVVIRSVGTELPPGPLALVRLVVAAAVLTPFVLRRSPRPVLPRGRTAWQVTGYGLMWFAGYNVALNAAERHVDAGTAALLVNVAPLLIAVGAGALLGEGFPRAVLVGGAVGLVGITVMTVGAGAQPGSGGTIGLTLGLLAAMLYAASVLVQKVVLREVDGLRATWLGCVVGAVALLPFGPQLVAELAVASPRAVLGAVYLGVAPTALAFTTWAYALRRMPAGRLSPIGYVATVLAMLLSWLLLGEAPTALVVLGGAISLLGVAISRRR